MDRLSGKVRLRCVSAYQTGQLRQRTFKAASRRWCELHSSDGEQIVCDKDRSAGVLQRRLGFACRGPRGDLNLQATSSDGEAAAAAASRTVADCELNRSFSMYGRGVIKRNRAVLWTHEQHDFRTAEDDRFRASVNKATDDLAIGLA